MSLSFESQLVFDSLLRQGRLRALGHHLRAYHRSSGERWRRILLQHTLLSLLPPGMQGEVRAARFHRGWEQVQSRLLPGWMAEDVRRDLSWRQLALTLQAERARRFGNPMRQMEYELLYPPEVARHPVPWPVELWRPFADRRLHAFLLAIPPEQKFAPHFGFGRAESRRIIFRSIFDRIGTRRWQSGLAISH